MPFLQRARLLRVRHSGLAVVGWGPPRGAFSVSLQGFLFRHCEELFLCHCEERSQKQSTLFVPASEAVPALEEETASQTKRRARSDYLCVSLRAKRSSLTGLLRQTKTTRLAMTADSRNCFGSDTATRSDSPLARHSELRSGEESRLLGEETASQTRRRPRSDTGKGRKYDLAGTLLTGHSEPFFFSPSEPRSGEESQRLLRRRYHDLAGTSPLSLRGA